MSARGPAGVVVTEATVKRILTRTSGYLLDVTSHSLQPYRGCTYGRALCGVGCYVRHSPWVTRGRPWGSFLEARTNAAASYRDVHEAERRWARRARGVFSIFMSSATDPYVPQERHFGITRRLLEVMVEHPPDALVVQTHSHAVVRDSELLSELARRATVRVHVSIESDRERLPGLPPPASAVHRRLDAARTLRDRGVPVLITVAPLLPIAEPEDFFRRIDDCADGVVLDHFIGGDGSPDGARTRATKLPEAMERLEPDSVDVAYRDRMVEIARRLMPGRVGVGASGFAGELR